MFLNIFELMFNVLISGWSVDKGIKSTREKGKRIYNGIKERRKDIDMDT